GCLALRATRAEAKQYRFGERDTSVGVGVGVHFFFSLRLSPLSRPAIRSPDLLCRRLGFAAGSARCRSDESPPHPVRRGGRGLLKLGQCVYFVGGENFAEASREAVNPAKCRFCLAAVAVIAVLVAE